MGPQQTSRQAQCAFAFASVLTKRKRSRRRRRRRRRARLGQTAAAQRVLIESHDQRLPFVPIRSYAPWRTSDDWNRSQSAASRGVSVCIRDTSHDSVQGSQLSASVSEAPPAQQMQTCPAVCPPHGPDHVRACMVFGVGRVGQQGQPSKVKVR